MNAAARLVSDIIDDFESLQNPAAVYRKIAQASSRCGYEAYVITTFPPSRTTENAFLGDTWREEWKRLYLKRERADLVVE